MVQRSLHALQEWFHFVDKEKQVRIRIDGKVNQMMAEAAELKQWTISEVSCSLGTHISILISICIAHVLGILACQGHVRMLYAPTPADMGPDEYEHSPCCIAF